MFEERSALREAIDVGRVDVRSSVTVQLGTQIIDADYEDVGAAFRLKENVLRLRRLCLLSDLLVGD